MTFQHNTGTLPSQDLRLVLLGEGQSGKSSAGNTILGAEEFDTTKRTAQCVSRQTAVAGRQVTVVDTPGWWWNHLLEMTSAQDKQEIALAVSHCPPGPHAFLLVLPLHILHAGTVEEHLNQLLGKRVWRHTMVLFTRGDWLVDTTIEQYISSEGGFLQRLVENCENRYHVIDNRNRENVTQVTDLLEKIERMVAHSGCYQIHNDVIVEFLQKREDVKIRGMLRLMKMERATVGGGGKRDVEVRAVLLGAKWVGRSMAGNTILGKVFDTERLAHSVRRQGEVAGRQVVLVDTPGWRCDFTTEFDSEEAVRSVALCCPGPHVLLIVIPVFSSFTKQRMRQTDTCLTLLGEKAWSHAMVLFTWGDWLGNTTIEQYIESEGSALQQLVEKCRNRYHVFNNKNNSDPTQVTELLEKIEQVVASTGHLEVDQHVLREIECQRMAVEDRAKERHRKALRQRETLRALLSDEPTYLPSDLNMVLVGEFISGKSASANTILGKEGVMEFDIACETKQNLKREGEVAGRWVTVVDTPGCFLECEETYRQHLKASLSLCDPGAHALLLTIPVFSLFTRREWLSVKKHLEVLGKDVWSHTIVLFTKGDRLGDSTIEQHIETNKHLLLLVDSCGNRFHVFDNQNRGDGTQVSELLEKIEEMVAGKSNKHLQLTEDDRKEITATNSLPFLPPNNEEIQSEDPMEMVSCRSFPFNRPTFSREIPFTNNPMKKSQSVSESSGYESLTSRLKSMRISPTRSVRSLNESVRSAFSSKHPSSEK